MTEKKGVVLFICLFVVDFIHCFTVSECFYWYSLCHRILYNVYKCSLSSRTAVYVYSTQMFTFIKDCCICIQYTSAHVHQGLLYMYTVHKCSLSSRTVHDRQSCGGIPSGYHGTFRWIPGPRGPGLEPLWTPDGSVPGGDKANTQHLWSPSDTAISPPGHADLHPTSTLISTPHQHWSLPHINTDLHPTSTLISTPHQHWSPPHINTDLYPTSTLTPPHINTDLYPTSTLISTPHQHWSPFHINTDPNKQHNSTLILISIPQQHWTPSHSNTDLHTTPRLISTAHKHWSPLHINTDLQQTTQLIFTPH